MENEWLLRAFGELDDDLITEAHSPVPQRSRLRTLLPRCAAIAACLVLVLTALRLALPRTHTPSVCLQEVELLEDGATVELPLPATLQLRSTSGTEIPLHLVPDGAVLTLTAGDGSLLLDADGTAQTTLTLSGETDLIWLVEPGAQTRFTLTLDSDGQTWLLTADVSAGQNCLRICAELP